MFVKKDIRLVTIAVHKTCHKHLVYEIGKRAVMQISETGTGDEKRRAEGLLDEGAIAALRSLILSALSDLGSPERALKQVSEAAGREVLSRNIKPDEERVAFIRRKYDQHIKLNDKLKSLIEKKESQLREIKTLSLLGIPQGLLDNGGLFFCIGKADDVPADYPRDKFYISTHNGFIAAVSMTEDREELAALLARCGFKDMTEQLRTYSGNECIAEDIGKEIRSLIAKREWLNDSIGERIKKWRYELESLLSTYDVLLQAGRAMKKFIYTSETVLVRGWISEERKEELESLLAEACGPDYFFHVADREEMKGVRNVPVLLKNNALFRPFEILVKNMGVPHNAEIDPTPLAALSYIIMFGVMFGDIGQGLVLTVTGGILRFVAGKKGRQRSFLDDGGTILVWGGLSAAFFGVLYGSVFSNEHLFPALLFHPMEEMMKLFFGAIMMGVALISTGMIVNIINAVITGNYEEALLGARGGVGLALYSGAVFLAVRFLVFDTAPQRIDIMLFLGLPLGIFAVRNVIAAVLFGRRPVFEHGFFEYAVETVVEMIEMLSGFLGNTISFIRAGAFALSHAGVSIAVYTLAEIVDPSLCSPGAIAVLIVGNLFIIALEGLVCGIQSMRLEYYEFFSRFFRGDGSEFTPFSLFQEPHSQGGLK